MMPSPFGRNLTVLPGLLSLYRRPVTYLDTNTVSDLARWRDRRPDVDSIEQVVRNLCSFASKRTIALGQWLFSEMAGYEGGARRPNFLADMGFVEQLQFLQIFRPSGEMRRLEIEAFFRGVEVNPVIATWLPSTTTDPELWKQERQQLEDLKTAYLKWEKGAKHRIENWHPGRESRVQQLEPEWKADPCGIVSRWVRKQMRKERTELGLPRDEKRWPHPAKLPTLWCGWAYRITRDMNREISRRSKTLKGSERRGSHAVDWCHFMTAAHADEFVSSDDDFLEIIRAAPEPKPEILHLTEWVGRLRKELGPF